MKGEHEGLYALKHHLGVWIRDPLTQIQEHKPIGHTDASEKVWEYKNLV